ncbi:hypothetical protein AAG906_005762 [Vitis piasezkii]
MASAAAASSSSSQRRYDVFLSFRGEDTRNNFTAHLYHALCQKGINTFIDDDKLERGQVISPALVAAIKNSMYSIVVLSKIMHPLDEDTGTFGEALAKHEENSENMERVESWKDALTQVANLSGWDSRNKNEHLLIKGIVTDILNKLLTTSISDTENLVGIDAHTQEIEMRLCLEFDAFLMVGIWGMGGIGKQPLLELFTEKSGVNLKHAVFFKMLRRIWQMRYEGTHIYKGKAPLEKVLIVLDNDWFGQGSRIIITTRDERMLISHGVLNCYEARRFNYDEAKRFLSHYLLKHEILRDDFIELSREVIGYAQGLPLALEVLGSFLFSMTKEEWRNQLDKLKRLDDKEKNIFLDIACFFKGDDKDYVMEILDALIEKSLITISWNNKLMMHDLIQEMGRKLFVNNPLKSLATEKIEGIFLNLSHLEEMLDFTTQALARMNRLRLLKVYKSKNISRNFKDISNMENCKVNFSKDFKFCYHELRCLYFYGYSLKSLPIDFNPKNLVELSMPYSHIKQLWKGLKVLEKLKFMDLSHSKYLIETPNFQGVTNLKLLVLEDCVSLRFPENFGTLEMLKELYADEIAIRGCKGPLSTLWLLPRRSSNSIGSILQPLSGLCSLTTLNLSNCNLSDEPNLSSLGFLSSLEDLHLALPELPSSIYHIYAENCTSLKGGSHQVLKSLLSTGKHQKRKFMGYFVASIASMAFIPGSRIPDWVTYQSSGSEVNVVIFPQVCYSTIVSMTVSFDNSSSFEIGPRMLHFNGSNEDGVRDSPPMIQFNSISSPPPPPIREPSEMHGCSNVDGFKEENSENHTADEEETSTATACFKDHSESDMRPQKCLKCRP